MHSSPSPPKSWPNKQKLLLWAVFHYDSIWLMSWPPPTGEFFKRLGQRQYLQQPDIWMVLQPCQVLPYCAEHIRRRRGVVRLRKVTSQNTAAAHGPCSGNEKKGIGYHRKPHIFISPSFLSSGEPKVILKLESEKVCSSLVQGASQADTTASWLNKPPPCKAISDLVQISFNTTGSWIN